MKRSPQKDSRYVVSPLLFYGNHAVSLYPTPQRFKKGTNMNNATVEVHQVRFTAEYPLLGEFYGEMNATRWMNEIFNRAVDAGKINSFELAPLSDSPSGIFQVHFTVTMTLDVHSERSVNDRGLEVLNNVVNDSDVEILHTEIYA